MHLNEHLNTYVPNLPMHYVYIIHKYIVCVCAFIYVWMYRAYICMYAYMQVCMYIFTHVCIYVCIYLVYAHICTILHVHNYICTHTKYIGVCLGWFYYIFSLDLFNSQWNSKLTTGELKSHFIYMISNLSVCLSLPVSLSLSQVFGVVVKLSDGILGITLLAWGNSIQGIMYINIIFWTDYYNHK